MSEIMRRKFTPEYRLRAAKLVIDTGRSIVSVANKIGVSAGLLGKWVKMERERTQHDALSESERAELLRLRKNCENSNLIMSSWEKQRASLLTSTDTSGLSLV